MEEEEEENEKGDQVSSKGGVLWGSKGAKECVVDVHAAQGGERVVSE